VNIDEEPERGGRGASLATDCCEDCDVALCDHHCSSVTYLMSFSALTLLVGWQEGASGL